MTRRSSDAQYIVCHFGLLWLVVSLAIIPHLLFYKGATCGSGRSYPSVAAVITASFFFSCSFFLGRGVRVAQSFVCVKCAVVRLSFLF